MGAAKIGCSFKNIQVLVFGPRGDGYVADMVVMRERSPEHPPIRCTNLGYREFARGSLPRLTELLHHLLQQNPTDLILIVPTVFSALLQENMEMILSHFENDKSRIIFSSVSPFRDSEDMAADKTLAMFVQKYFQPLPKSEKPSVNLMGIALLKYGWSHDLAAVKDIMAELGVAINLTFPMHSSVYDLANLGKAWVHIPVDRVLTCSLSNYIRQHSPQSVINGWPYGLANMKRFLSELGSCLGMSFEPYIMANEEKIMAKWGNYLGEKWAGKSVAIFGDFTTVTGLAKTVTEDLKMALKVVGTYNTNYEPFFRKETERLSERVIVADDDIVVAQYLEKSNPQVIMGTLQEERIASQRGIPFIRISTPMRHVSSVMFPSQSFIGYQGFDNLLYNLQVAE